MVQDGPTNTGYGTTNADAGEGIGMLKRGFKKILKKQFTHIRTYFGGRSYPNLVCVRNLRTYVRT